MLGSNRSDQTKNQGIKQEKREIRESDDIMLDLVEVKLNPLEDLAKQLNEIKIKLVSRTSSSFRNR